MYLSGCKIHHVLSVWFLAIILCFGIYIHMKFLKAFFCVKNYVCPLGSLLSYAYELATVFMEFNKIAIILIKKYSDQML